MFSSFLSPSLSPSSINPLCPHFPMASFPLVPTLKFHFGCSFPSPTSFSSSSLYPVSVFLDTDPVHLSDSRPAWRAPAQQGDQDLSFLLQRVRLSLRLLETKSTCMQIHKHKCITHHTQTTTDICVVRGSDN